MLVSSMQSGSLVFALWLWFTSVSGILHAENQLDDGVEEVSHYEFTSHQHSRKHRIARAAEKTLGDERFSAFGFTAEPADVVGSRGGQVRFDCAVHSVADVKITWKKDGAYLVTDADQRRLLPNGSLVLSNINDAGRTLRSDDGTYQCFVEVSDVGTFVTRRARLTLATLSRFDEQPVSKTVEVGATVVFPCWVDAVPAANYTWLKNNIPMQLDRNERLTILPLTGSLEIRDVTLADAGSYRCSVANVEKQRTSEEGQLRVKEKDGSLSVEPTFERTPRSAVARAGSPFVLECSANGIPEPVITWLKEGKELKHSFYNESRAKIVGQGTLMVFSAVDTDSGQFTCRAANAADSVESHARVEVHVPPVIVEAPKSLVARETEDVEFECKALGKPPPSVTWLKDGEQFLASSYFRIEGTKLRILGLVLDDSGIYQCVVDNTVGSAQASAQLLVEQSEIIDIWYEQLYGKARTTVTSGSSELPPTIVDFPDAASVSSAGIAGSPLPTEPKDLAVLSLGSRDITLKWNPPVQSHGDVLAYGVYYKEEASTRERVLNVTVQEATIAMLAPNTTYKFRVVAYNEHGPGLSSAPQTVRTKLELAVPSRVQNIRGESLSSTSVRLMWDAPIGDGGTIERYKVFYAQWTTQLASGARLSLEEETQVETSVPTYEFHGLTKNTAYTFRVEAFNSNGGGPSSESVVVTTYSDVPSTPPEKITARAAGARSVVVNWEPPLMENQNGVLTGYKIRYKMKQRGSKGQTFTVDSEARTRIISNLEPASQYVIRMAAINVNGTGPNSDWITASTYSQDLDESQVPPSPSNMQVVARSDSVVVTWDHPVDSSILVRGYTVGWGVGVPDVHSTSVQRSQLQYVIENLQSNREYVISLKAYNDVGGGFPVYETVRTLDHRSGPSDSQPPLATPLGLRALATSPESMELTWTDTSLPLRDGEKRYVVRYTTNAVSRGKYLYLNSTTTRMFVEGLQPHTQYEFSVKSVSGLRESAWSLSVLNTTLTAPPGSAPRDITIVPVDNPTTVRLNWQPPRLSNGPITGYFIMYTHDINLKDGQWKVEGVSGDRMSTSVTNLLPDTTYYFKMQAINEKGYGPTSDVQIHTLVKSGFATNQPAPAVKGFIGPPATNAKKDGDSAATQDSDATAMQDGGASSRTIIIVAACSVGGLAALLLIVIAIICFCRTRSGQNDRRGYKSGVKVLKENPPDLWINHEHVELKQNGKNASRAASTQDLQLHAPTPPSLSDMPRYEAAVWQRTPDSDNPYGSPDSSTVERRRERGENTLPRGGSQPRQNVSTSELATSRPYPSRVSPSPCTVVYTGPRHETALQSHNVRALGTTTVQSVEPPFVPRSTPPPPFGGGSQTQLTPGAHRTSNPLTSFVMPAPPPPSYSPPLRPHQAAYATARENKFAARVKQVPAQMVCNSPRRTPAVIMGSRAVGGTPRLAAMGTPMSDLPYGSSRDTDNDTSVSRSFSTEELNTQMQTLDTLMKDLSAISTNEFDS